ncbi:fungal-specific transcription factor domain-containing protein [Biscogniauxia marginata]|nr:fungal-specific transcription factor domain-containing protein [Biscogniauxia marginata]
MGLGVENEVRVRSGCHKCRERRVKCPEQRPICRHCQRLGFVCKYELRLSWQRVTTQNLFQSVRKKEYNLSNQKSIQPWMFINVIYGDFPKPKIKKSEVHWRAKTPTLKFRNTTSSSLSDWHLPANTSYEETADFFDRESSKFSTIRLRHLVPYHLSEADAYLWDYFDKSMTPQCVLDQSSNPYRNIILRLAIAFLGGPLFHCVLAVAANQLNSLGRTEYLPSMWTHRAHALRRLRGTVKHLCTLEIGNSGPDGDLDGDETVACALMLCFFDISQDCSESWTVHSRFSGDFLLTRSRCTKCLSAEEQALQDFAVTYFISHDVLASTASTTRPWMCETTNKLCAFADPRALQNLTGCSKELFILISEINSLGSVLDGLDLDTHEQQPLSGDRKRWRDEIERRLHDLKQHVSTDVKSFDEETHNISEAKRLAALMYLYGRLDRASPHEPCMVRLTLKALSIIPKISLRTNTVLWPLFIIATLGIRPESDEDRNLVLGRLAALQNTRQLGNVKKARHVIESVWKARDLKISNPGLGWEVLQERHQTISLA